MQADPTERDPALVLKCDSCGGVVDPTVEGVDHRGRSQCAACRARAIGWAEAAKEEALERIEYYAQHVAESGFAHPHDVRAAVERGIQRAERVRRNLKLGEIQTEAMLREQWADLIDSVHGRGQHDVRRR